MTVNECVKKSVGLTLLYNIEKRFWRGDNANFTKKKIPTIYLHTCKHPDYHSVTDNADKMETIKFSRVARLVFLTT